MAATKRKSPAQLNRDIAESLARAEKGPRQFGGWYVPNVPPGRYSAHHEVEGSFPRSRTLIKITDPKRKSFGPGPRSASERQIHPEMFALLDRKGKILGTARTVKGAMSKAPNDKSYATVRGEFTSDGTSHGVGHGRVMATREYDPSGGFRWYVDSESPM